MCLLRQTRHEPRFCSLREGRSWPSRAAKPQGTARSPNGCKEECFGNAARAALENVTRQFQLGYQRHRLFRKFVQWAVLHHAKKCMCATPPAPIQQLSRRLSTHANGSCSSEFAPSRCIPFNQSSQSQGRSQGELVSPCFPLTKVPQADVQSALVHLCLGGAGRKGHFRIEIGRARDVHENAGALCRDKFQEVLH